jgi:chemotaxis protein methyltransferase CheR
MLELKQDEFVKYQKLVYENFGINLTQEKFNLVESRLLKLISKKKMNSFGEFFDWVINDDTNQAMSILIDRISTNHTYFYREVEHFSFLKNNLKLLSSLAATDPKNEIRIWSAGCSYGDEPYSYAVFLKYLIDSSHYNFNIKILATDVNREALEYAQHGVYDESRIKDLPSQLKARYFDKVAENMYQVKDEIKKMVLYRRLNFMNSSFPFTKKFHLISCRNVMIYFDQKTKDELVSKFFRHIHSNGLLFIGHSESIPKNNRHFKLIQPAVFKPITV